MKIHMKDDPKPYCITSVRRIPFPILPKGKKYFKLLEGYGINEKNLPTHWCVLKEKMAMWVYVLTWSEIYLTVERKIDLPNPTCVCKLRPAIGMVRYLKRFLHNAADFI